MSQTVITTAFETLKAQQAAANTPVVLDEFVFANVPGLNITDPIDPAEALPTAGQIVHRAAVSKTGVVNANTVVYSVTLGADVGDFSFNWVGLRDKTSNTLAMIVHAPVQQKVKNNAGTQGNVLTRSFLMEYDGAKKETQITTPAGTWQIDFTARLAGMDERQRIENIDIYGNGAFLGDGFLVKRSGNDYSATAGTGYVGGLRAALAADQALTVASKPVKVWVDTCFTGTLTSVWQVSTVVTIADTLADYVKNDVNHYVYAVAQINADGTVTDLRPNARFLRQDQNLKDVPDKAEARKSLELKGAAQRDVGTASGNLLEVGAFGLGLDKLTTTISFDWNTYLFRAGEKILITPAQVTNWPAGMDASAAYSLDVACVYNTGDVSIYASPKKSTLAETKLTPSYEIRIVMSGNARNFIVNELFQRNREQMIDNGLRSGSAGLSNYSNDIFLRSFSKASGIDNPNSPVSELYMGWFAERFAMRLYRGVGQDVSHVVFNFNGSDVYRFHKNGECYTNGTDRIITQSQLDANKFAQQSWVTAQNYATQSWVNAQGYAAQAWVSGNFCTIAQREAIFARLVAIEGSYIRGVRFGAVETSIAFNGPGYPDALGYVITGVSNTASGGNSDQYIDSIHRRPLQINVNGSWMNIGN